MSMPCASASSAILGLSFPSSATCWGFPASTPRPVPSPTLALPRRSSQTRSTGHRDVLRVRANCEQAQFINANFDTAVWTDYAQPDPCVGGASRSEVLNVINSCTDAGNPLPLHTGQDMNTNDGMIDNVFELTYSCFAKDTFNPSGGGSTIWSGLLDQLDVDTSFDGSGASPQHPPQPNTPWKWKLPVVNCTNTDCDELRGAVQVDVLWIVNQDGVEDAPYEMSRTARDGTTMTWSANVVSQSPCMVGVNGGAQTWPCSTPCQGTGCPASQVAIDPPTGDATVDGTNRWASFVNAFNIVGASTWPTGGNSNRVIYFAPDCGPVTPLGGTGGANFGVRSNVPVLVD